ncbi:MAG: HEAT repeat domain-containing protein [Planctomycetota bacterium]
MRGIVPAAWWGIAVTAAALSPAWAGEVEDLAAQLASPDGPKREEAARALAELGPAAAPALPALLTACKDKLFKVRAAAASAIGAIGPDARAQAGERLLELAQDPSASVREAAGAALRQVGAGPAALKRLGAMLADKEWKVRALALDVIAELGADAASLLDEIERLTSQDPSGPVRKAAHRARKKLVEAIDRAKDRGEDPEAKAKAEAMRAEAEAKAKAKAETEAEAAPAWKGKPVAELRAALREAKDPAALVAALKPFQEMGPLGEGALEELQPLLGHESLDVRRAAAGAFACLGRAGAPAADALIKLLDEQDASTRSAAARALAALGAAAKGAVPKLVAALERDPQDSLAHIVVAGIGPDAAPALELLRKAFLASPRRGSAGFALAGLGKAGVEALLDLARAPAQPPHVRVSAYSYAASAREEAPGLVDELRKLLAASAEAEDGLPLQLASAGLRSAASYYALPREVLGEVEALRAKSASREERDSIDLLRAGLAEAMALRAALGCDPRDEAAIPGLLALVVKGDESRRLRDWLDYHAGRSLALLRACQAQQAKQPNPHLGRLLAKLTGQAPE